jgi:hypothetical protein
MAEEQLEETMPWARRTGTRRLMHVGPAPAAEYSPTTLTKLSGETHATYPYTSELHT